MSILLNSSGVPKGAGSLQVRGRVWWMIYADEAGRRVQANTGMTELPEARRVLAFQAIKVLKARMAALVEVLDETREAEAKGVGGLRRANTRKRAVADRGLKSNAADRAGSSKGGAR